MLFFNYAENNTKDKHFNMEHIYKIPKALDIPIAKFLRNRVIAKVYF